MWGTQRKKVGGCVSAMWAGLQTPAVPGVDRGRVVAWQCVSPGWVNCTTARKQVGGWVGATWQQRVRGGSCSDRVGRGCLQERQRTGLIAPKENAAALM